MSGYASLMEIILIEDKVSKKPNAQTGVHTQWKEARAILRKEDGSVSTVGMFRIPQTLEASATIGLFSVGFTLGVQDYGDNAGKIQAQFVSLTPVDPKSVFGRGSAGSVVAASATSAPKV